MTEILLAVIAFLLIVLTLLGFLMKRTIENRLMGSQGTPHDFEKYFSKTENTFKDEFARNRNEASVNAKNIREELSNSLKNFFDTFANQFKTLSETSEKRLDGIRETLESKLKSIQDDNNEKLEKMRATVDEKLHATLEQRLGESFKIVSERLELVHKGLGEMQSLATGVGDLKKVLSNVKTRGILGEFQLENILEQILTPGQYGKNIATKKGSNDTVEFAIKLPGRGNNDKVLWLPLDSKFPLESYHSLMDAYEQANPTAIDEATANLERNIKKCAKDIKEKYVDPPNTTDFAVMFLPIEGLYAEVVRRTNLIEILQRDFKIAVTGPTTLAAFLNSLQMGFRTLAIEKRSSEIWNLLGVIKTEFGKFGRILEETDKKLQEASSKIKSASRESRTIERKLRTVEELPLHKADKYLEDTVDNEETS